MRFNKSILAPLFTIGMCLGMLTLYHLWDIESDLYLRDIDQDIQPDINMLSRMYNAPSLMTDQVHLRPLANFTISPRILITGHPINARWVAINLVKSAAKNLDRRRAIRKTWGSMKVVDGVQIETVFIVGSTTDDKLQNDIDQEGRGFGDILQTTTLEQQSSLPYKTLAGMQWVADNIPGHWLYSSCVDDMALHPQNFVRFIDSKLDKYTSLLVPNTSRTRLLSVLPIMCMHSYKELDYPSRDPEKKRFASPDVYEADIWPPHCRGGWYTIPVSIVEKLHRISRKTKLISMDDVWITGILRVKMLASQPNVTENSIRKSGIIAAPLASRSDKALESMPEEDATKVIVKHMWGNIKDRPANVVDRKTETWNRWVPLMDRTREQRN